VIASATDAAAAEAIGVDVEERIRFEVAP